MDGNAILFPIGSYVINFGLLGRVIGYHDLTGDLILRNERIGNWIARPSLCRKYDPEA